MRLDATSRAALRQTRRDPVPRLLRAEDTYAARELVGSTAPPPICEWAWTLYPPVFVDRHPPDMSRRGETDTHARTVARVEHGRWVADCPFCPSAQVVSPADPRYLCAGLDGCANEPVRGAYASVVFPDDIDVIEALLLERPGRTNRNWRPGETVKTLAAENKQHLGKQHLGKQKRGDR